MNENEGFPINGWTAVTKGDSGRVGTSPPLPSTGKSPTTMPLHAMPPVLYEDNHLLAVDKPAGVGVQPDASGDPSLLDLARAYLKEKYAKPGHVFLAPAHRLDRPVSGVLLFARTGKAASRLADAFRTRAVEKEYHAIVERGPSPAADHEGFVPLIDGFLPGVDGAPSRVVGLHTPRAKRAELTYRVDTASARRALLTVRPRTGYKHQIRVQLAAAGLTVVGDFRYGPRGARARPTPFMDGHGIALHASRLRVRHPTRDAEIELVAPWPVPFASLAASLG